MDCYLEVKDSTNPFLPMLLYLSNRKKISTESGTRSSIAVLGLTMLVYIKKP